MQQYETQFERRLSAVRYNADAACRFVYTELVLHFFFSGDFDVRDRVNPHAAFWNSVLGALQTAGFMALGRLYDRDDGSDTIGSLLKYASTHTGIFQPLALKARKERGGLTPESAAAYIEGVFELPKGGFKPLQQVFERFQSLYKANVEPIRNEVFAHAGRLTQQNRDALFTQVFLRDLERMVVFPIRLCRALDALYDGGREPMLDEAPTLVTDILNALPPDWTNTWEHLHVVKETAEFISWLKQTPIPEDRALQNWVAAFTAVIEAAENDGAHGG